MNSVRIISFITRATVAIILIVIAFIVVYLLVSTKPKVEVKSGERALTAVVAIEVHPVPVKRTTMGYGVADAMQHADVSAQISAAVVMLPLTSRVGSKVRKGDLLVELNDVDFQQQVIRAEQALATAKSELSLLSVERQAADERAALAIQDQILSQTELDRVINAFNRGAAKQREVDAAHQKLISVSSKAVNTKELADRFPLREEQASSNITTREADLELTKESLRRCSIISPIDGVLQAVDVRVGEHVQSGTRVARVVHSGSLEIPLRLPSFARSFVSIGDDVNLRSTGFGLRQWKARVSRIAPEDDTQTRTMIVYVDYNQDPNAPNHIPPGLFVSGEVINDKDTKPRWIVPRRSFRNDRLMVIRDSVLRSVLVTIDYSVSGEYEEFGVPDHDWVVLETSLVPGDLVVVDPGGSLRDGMKVRVIIASEVALE